MAATNDPKPDDALTDKEAARITGLSYRTLQKLRWKGGGPPFVHYSSRAVRYRRGDVEQWVAERVRQSTSDPGPESRS